MYVFCDFSDTTHGSQANKMFCDSLSSSATSRIPVDYELTDPGYGSMISWKCITASGYTTTTVGHRLTIVAETQEDL